MCCLGRAALTLCSTNERTNGWRRGKKSRGEEEQDKKEEQEQEQEEQLEQEEQEEEQKHLA